jgi:hypothetical protein
MSRICKAYSPLLASLFLGFLLLGSHSSNASLVINEILTDNFSSLPSKDGNYYGWVELYNKGETAVQLEGWSLTDNPSSPQKYKLPAFSLSAGGYVLVFFSGLSGMINGEIHAPFLLSKKDTRLYLYSPNASLASSVGPLNLPGDVSFAFIPNGSGNGGTYKPSSPKKSNNQMIEWVPFFQTVSISPSSGSYPQDSLFVKLTVSDPFTTLYYTLDGSEPSVKSNKYTGPIQLKSQHRITPSLSYIPSSPSTAKRGEIYAWRAPKKEPYSAVFIKTQGFKNGKPVTPVRSATYFIGKDAFPHTLSTFVLSSPKQSLFGDTTGIYVPGINLDNNPDPSSFLSGGNFHESGPEWERELEVQFLDLQGQLLFEQRMGVRIHGYGSRSYPQKSLRLHARDLYDKDVANFPFFPNSSQSSFKHLILRNAGQDCIRSMFSDALSCSFYEGLDVDYQLHRPVVHYLNGEYFGIANLRERVHERMIASKHGLNPDNIILLEPSQSNLDGGDPAYADLLAFVSNTPLNTPEATKEIYTQIDVPSYITYTLCKIIIGAYDWPGNNLRIWRDKSKDPRFRWILFDSDDAFSTPPQKNTLLHALEEERATWPNPAWSTLLLRKLLSNDSFSSHFLHIAEELLTNVFTTEKMIQNIDSFQRMYEDEISRHIDRWQLIPSKNIWERNIESYRKFAQLRPCYLKSFFVERFDLDPASFLPHLSCDSMLFEMADLEILGNPGYNQVEIKLTVETEQDVTIRLYQSNGQIVYEAVRFAITGQNTYPLEISTPTTPGIYFVSISGKRFKVGGKWLRYEQ